MTSETKKGTGYFSENRSDLDKRRRHVTSVNSGTNYVSSHPFYNLMVNVNILETIDYFGKRRPKRKKEYVYVTSSTGSVS